MKKISRVILNVFRKIALFIDKLIIIPITKLILKVMDFFKGNAKSIDRFVSKKSTLLVVSLVLAFGTYLVVDRESSVMIDQYAEILYDRPVTAAYNEEAYVVEGSEEIVNKIDSSSLKAYIDLEKYGVGTHEVEVKVTGEDLKLSYTSKTKKVKVVITEK